jgi:hypothetical protein
MTSHWFASDDGDTHGEALADGGTWLLDLVAAVDHLRRGHRPGFTVWDALEEALRWTLPGDGDEPWESADPLRETLRRFVTNPAPTPDGVQAAARRWVTTMADRYNDGHHWPHPVARRGFPPPLLTANV